MEMIDMKHDNADKSNKNLIYDTPEDFNEKYPYNLRIKLNNEQINKIQSLQDLKPGDKVIITAEASVVKCEMCQKMKGSGNVDESNNMDIQIEKMNMSPIVTKKLEDMDMKEYRNARRMKM